MGVRPCGTRAAYVRHLHHGEPACDACLAANSDRTRRAHLIPADPARARTPKREVIWAYLIANPGKTAYEITRYGLDLGANPGSGRTMPLLLRMERDGQVTRHDEMRPGQVRPVSAWFAVPGSFAAVHFGGQR